MAWVDNVSNLSELPTGATDSSGAAMHNENDIKPEDSVSELCASLSDRHSNFSRKSRSTLLSHASSIKSARIKESLRKVTLMAEASNLVEKQTLLCKEYEFSMEK